MKKASLLLAIKSILTDNIGMTDPHQESERKFLIQRAASLIAQGSQENNRLKTSAGAVIGLVGVGTLGIEGAARILIGIVEAGARARMKASQNKNNST